MKDYVAFWKYDLFPFVLSGHITKMREDGCVQLEEYGVGKWFMPFKILPTVTGEKLAAELKALEGHYDAAVKRLKDEFMKKRNEIIKVPK